jgi:hypothetical protein
MAVITVDAYGAPSYGPLRGVEGIVAHTPENADPTLAAAIAIAKWQASSSNVSGGSYHGIAGHNSAKYPHGIAGCTEESHWTMVRSVRWDQAAGGLSTRRDSIWQPGRYPWIEALLSDAAYADPNGFMHQISISGKAAWYVANGYPLGLRKMLAEWIITLESAYKYDAVLTQHRMWQTNRSDPGPLDLWDKVLVEYEKKKAAPVVTPTPTPTTPTIASLTARIATKNDQFDRAGLRVRDLERAMVTRGHEPTYRSFIEGVRVPLRTGRQA